jgi:hypothetical protein
MARPRRRGISSRIAALLGAVVLVSGCACAETRRTAEGRMNIELESESPEVRLKASVAVVASRDSTIRELEALARKYLAADERRGTVKDLMLLMGRLRASECVEFLVSQLTFEVYYKETKRPQTTKDLYPAVQALIDIGSPAVAPTLLRLASEDGEVLQRCGSTAGPRVGTRADRGCAGQGAAGASRRTGRGSAIVGGLRAGRAVCPIRSSLPLPGASGLRQSSLRRRDSTRCPDTSPRADEDRTATSLAMPR